MRAKAVALLIFITVIFQHFQLMQIGTFRVTVALFTGSVLVVVASKTIDLSRLTAVWVSIVVLSSLAALFAAGITNDRFPTTLLLALLTSLFVVAATRGFRPDLKDNETVWNTVRLALIVIVGLSVAQTVTGALGSEVLFNPFGQFQYQNEYLPNLQFNPVPRAEGFFLEPSYNAFVIGSLAVALVSARRHVRSTMVLAITGMAACQSATGLIILLVIAAVLAVKSRPGIAIPTIAAAGLLTIFLGNYLLSRIGSTMDVGSSANYRLVAPLVVLGDVLRMHPLGLPFGSIYTVIATYGLTMVGVDRAVSLDNGIYVVIYYFGWIGLGFVGLLAVWSFSAVFRPSIRNGEHSYHWIAPVWLLGALLFSGGIIAPEFGLMTWLTVISYVESRPQKGIPIDTKAVIERGHRHVSRHKWPATDTAVP